MGFEKGLCRDGVGRGGGALRLVAGVCLLGALGAPRLTAEPRVADAGTASQPGPAAPSASAAKASDARPSASAPTLDALFAAAWAREGVTPAPVADDAEFLRRVSLDLIGRVPSIQDVIAFLRDKRPQKRQRKVDELLASPLYADHMTDTWSVLLLGRKTRGEDIDRKAFRRWLWGQFSENVSYPKFVTALLTAPPPPKKEDGKGEIKTEEAVGLYLQSFREAPLDAAGHVTRVFQGVQIQCAQCHNHPYEKWKQEDFYGMAAFFVNDPRIPGKEDRKRIAPQIITGERPSGGGDRKAQLAALITAPENPYFAKAIVNRVWGDLFGRGFVDPVDDFRESNPATVPEAMDALAGEFARNGYDLKWLLRTIATSQVYQRTSRPPRAGTVTGRGTSPSPLDRFARGRLRSLTPEQFFFSLAQATGPEAMVGGASGQSAEQMAEGIFRRFTHVFMDDERREEATFEGTIPQALWLLNGRCTNDALASRMGREGSNRRYPARGGDAPAMQAPPAMAAGAGGRPNAARGSGVTPASGKPGAGGAAPAGTSMKGAMPAPAESDPGGRSELARMQTPSRDPGKAAPPPPAPGAGQLDAILRETTDAGERVDWIFVATLGRLPNGVERARYTAHALGHSNKREAYEDVMWTLLNSTEFAFNH